MRAPIALSKTKLLSLTQCRRKLWLETYNPELVPEPSAEKRTLLDVGNVVGEIARRLYGRGGGHVVSFDRGLRAAIDATRALIAAGGSEPIFEATFDRDGVSARIDVLERGEHAPRMIEVKSSASVKEHYLDDCAVQAWALEENGLAPRQIAVATIDTSFVYEGDGRYDGLLVETDVTDLVRARLPLVPKLVSEARQLLAQLDEPDVAVGVHCGAPHGCDFYSHCGPPATKYSVLALSGSKEQLFELLHSGFADVRDVPEDRLTSDTQRLIWRQSRAEQAHIGAELKQLARALPFPRYYLDFETMGPAVPIFAGTRPFEALPFQWSCHIEPQRGTVEHAEFLDLSSAPPMRALAEHLVAALGTQGPIVVYTQYERRVIGDLAARYPDLAERLHAAAERIVDLHPATRAHYYHPAMQGSWSIKAVVPTVAPDLRYDTLRDVRDGLGAQAAYLEAIDPKTPPARRTALDAALRAYCRQDTLALVRLVEFFARD
ncbi:MAG TPA: DUF2779 domain-containing protein [Gammaproteobacteria bacterium]